MKLCSTKFIISRIGPDDGNTAPVSISKLFVKKCNGYVLDDKGGTVDMNKFTSKSYGSYTLYFTIE